MSRITSARVIVTCPGRNFVTLKIETEDGVTGLGDATLNGRELAVASYLTDHVVPLLIGRDAHRIEDIWQYLYRGAYWRRGPVTMSAIAAVDVALWDIKAKIADLPLYQLLGGACRGAAWPTGMPMARASRRRSTMPASMPGKATRRSASRPACRALLPLTASPRTAISTSRPMPTCRPRMSGRPRNICAPCLRSSRRHARRWAGTCTCSTTSIIASRPLRPCGSARIWSLSVPSGWKTRWWRRTRPISA